MHRLLAQAIYFGSPAGVMGPEGWTVAVTTEPGLTRFDLLASGDPEPRSVAWRMDAVGERPPGLPSPIPHVPHLGAIAVLEPTGLTVTWPDAGPGFGPGFGAGQAGGLAGGLGGLGGSVRPARQNDPVAEAWSLLTSGGDGGHGARALEVALEGVVRQSLAAGWVVGKDELLKHPLMGRVVSLDHGGARRTLTFTVFTGVATLVLLEPAHDIR